MLSLWVRPQHLARLTLSLQLPMGGLISMPYSLFIIQLKHENNAQSVN